MSTLYGYPAKKPCDTGRLMKAELRSPHPFEVVHERITAETMEYTEAMIRMQNGGPWHEDITTRFMGYVFDDYFLLWRVAERNILRLGVVLENIPGGTNIIVTSDIRNYSLSLSGMAIGIAIPAVVGCFTASLIASSWLWGILAAAIGIWAFYYAVSIRKRLVRRFNWDVGQLRMIVDGNKGSSDAGIERQSNTYPEGPGNVNESAADVPGES